MKHVETLFGESLGVNVFSSWFSSEPWKAYVLLMLAAAAIYFKVRARPSRNDSVPMAPFALPLLGHSLYIYFDPAGFLRYSYKSCGSVFKIRLFFTTVTYIANRELVNGPFFKAATTLSSSDVFNEYSREAFFTRVMPLGSVHNLIRKSLLVSDSSIQNHVSRVSELLAKCVKAGKVGGRINLHPEVKRFTVSGVFETLFGLPVPKEILKNIVEFVEAADLCIGGKAILPKSVADLLLLRSVIRKRKALVAQLLPFIDGTDKFESPFLQAAAEETWMTDIDKAEVVIVMFHLTLGGTASAICNLLWDVCSSPFLVKEMRPIADAYIKSGDPDVVLNNPLFHACVLETARLHPNIISLMRKPKPSAKVGGYYFGDADFVVVCQMLLQVHGQDTPFANPLLYNPNRFLGPNPEPSGSFEISSWSAGVHSCPGRHFSIKQMKLVLAHFLSEFDFDAEKSIVSKGNPASSGFFEEREKMDIFLTVRKM